MKATNRGRGVDLDTFFTPDGGLERRLQEAAQVVPDRLEPQDHEEDGCGSALEQNGTGLEAWGEYADATGRLGLRKTLVPRTAGHGSQPALT